MKISKIVALSTLVIAASMLLNACAPAANSAAAPAQPTAVPVQPTAEAGKPTDAPKSTDAPANSGIALPDVDPASLAGDIGAAGSSTVYPLIEAIASDFKADGFTGEIKIDSIGTGGGFERFCKTGETDISNASRPINDKEKANCATLNPVRNPIEFRVGTDAIAIVVSKQNTFLTNVTLEELAMIFGDKAEKWSDVNPAWPAETIQRFTPGTDSGTFDFFAETVIQKPQKLAALDDAKKIVLAAKNLQTSEDDNVLVQGVEGSPYAVGYFGFAYYKNQEDRLNVVSVNGVAPSFDSAESGEYKLSRPLFLYSDANILKQKPQVTGFINYFLSNVNDVIQKVGYFPASQAALDASKQALLDATK